MASWPPPSWVEVIYVIPLYGVSRGLNLNLSSMGGRSLKLTDYYRAEARCYLPDRAKTEAETMTQSQGRAEENCLQTASSTTSLHRTLSSRQMQAICMHDTNQTRCKRAAATSCRAPLFSPHGRRSALRRRADGNNVAAVSHGQHPLPSTVAAANTAMHMRGNENVESKKKLN